MNAVVTQPYRLPNFLVIGAQKSATTWLWSMLRQHPEIFMPKEKELGYFCFYPMCRRVGWKGELVKTLLDDYGKLYFSNVTNEKAIGEATPGYLWVSDQRLEWLVRDPTIRFDTPSVVMRLLGPATKLLVVLRNPVDRAISGFHHNQKVGTLEPNAKFMESAHLHGIVHMGFYYEHLSKWMETFDRANFKILIMEEDLLEPHKALADIFQFLEVDSEVTIKNAHQKIHMGVPGSQVSQEDREKLREIFASDIRKLEKLLDRDLSIWNPLD
jgi:hypothetical protein